MHVCGVQGMRSGFIISVGRYSYGHVSLKYHGEYSWRKHTNSGNILLDLVGLSVFFETFAAVFSKELAFTFG